MWKGPVFAVVGAAITLLVVSVTREESVSNLVNLVEQLQDDNNQIAERNGELTTRNGQFLVENEELATQVADLEYDLSAMTRSRDYLRDRVGEFENILAQQAVQEFEADPAEFFSGIVENIGGRSGLGNGHPGFIVRAVEWAIRAGNHDVDATEQFKLRWIDLSTLQEDWAAVRPSLGLFVASLGRVYNMEDVRVRIQHCPSAGVTTEQVLEMTIQDGRLEGDYCTAFLQRLYSSAVGNGKTESQAIALIGYVREEIIPQARPTIAWAAYLQELSRYVETAPWLYLVGQAG